MSTKASNIRRAQWCSHVFCQGGQAESQTMSQHQQRTRGSDVLHIHLEQCSLF